MMSAMLGNRWLKFSSYLKETYDFSNLFKTTINNDLDLQEKTSCLFDVTSWTLIKGSFIYNI